MSYKKTTFHIAKMDCASEEQLIRMRLEELPEVKSMQFDLPIRELAVIHTDGSGDISAALQSLELGSELVTSEQIQFSSVDKDHELERKLLWQVLLINFSFFILEILTGIFADSMGLVADSLDMFADSMVYGLSLFAVGGTITRKKSIAKASGVFQLLLAISGLVEVIRRFLGFGDLPDFQLMIGISILALIGNSFSLFLLQKSNNKEAHMQASMIFTSNDVIANIGVILAGVLVYITTSKIPDLIIGMIVFAIVGRGAFRILQLSKTT